MEKSKKKYSRELALRVANEILEALTPATELIIIAGSIRRRKAFVGDIEIVFVPILAEEPDGLFDKHQFSRADRILDQLIKTGVIEKRKNILGSEIWGPKNKLGRHCKTGIPIDFFATRTPCWWNYVCYRTGGSRNNTLIAEAYQRRRSKWNPYGIGFTNERGEEIQNPSEAAVYLNAGLRYLKPFERP